MAECGPMTANKRRGLHVKGGIGPVLLVLKVTFQMNECSTLLL